MVDIPDGLDPAHEVIIYGVESEQIEEENDAYNDMRCELGKAQIIHSKSLHNNINLSCYF